MPLLVRDFSYLLEPLSSDMIVIGFLIIRVGETKAALHPYMHAYMSILI